LSIFKIQYKTVFSKYFFFKTQKFYTFIFVEDHVVKYVIIYYYYYYRAGQKTGPFLIDDNFAAVNGRKACDRPQCQKFANFIYKFIGV